MTNHQIRWVCIFAIGIWACLHLSFSSAIIYHDSWKHIFPISFSVARATSCSSIPTWLPFVDGGVPHVIHVISQSTNQALRLPFLYAVSCLELSSVTSLYLYKFQIYLSYLVFSLGMYLLGRQIYKQQATALYLLIATLFAGLCLDSSHSDQVISLLFWIPWIALCISLYYENRGTKIGARYLSCIAIFSGIQALDMYPHSIALGLIIALLIYLCMERTKALSAFVQEAKYIFPALFIILIVAFQLIVVKDNIENFRPSLRADILVDPKSFGETGFAQPTALIASFFPLSMLHSHDTLAAGLGALLARHHSTSGLTGFMYKYDTLFFHVGIVPIFFFIVSIFSENFRRFRTGWIAFTAVMFLVALQQSKIYLLLNNLPFFNVFRGYGLFLCLTIFGFLVCSGFGFNYLLMAKDQERKRLIKKSILAITLSASAAFACLGFLIILTTNKTQELQNSISFLLMDVTVLILSVLIIRLIYLTKWNASAAVLSVVALSITGQLIYTVGVYKILGTPASEVISMQGLKPIDAIPKDVSDLKPSEFKRQQCTTFAQCYLSLRPSASIRLDHEGTFLRSRQSVLYHADASAEVVSALSGISHPVYWASQNIKHYNDLSEIITPLNEAGSKVGDLLHKVTFVESDVFPGSDYVQMRSVPNLKSLQISSEKSKIHYQSDTMFYLNASVTYDKNWKANIDGLQVDVFRGNFDGLVIQAPPGAHTVEFFYKSWRSDLFFLTRLVLILLAFIVVIKLTFFGPSLYTYRPSIET